MNIFSRIKKLSIILFLFITSCEYLDLCSIVNSETIDFRFDDNKKYSKHPNPTINDSENFSFLIVSDTHYYKKSFGYGKRLDKLRQDYNAAFLIVNGDISQSGLEKQFNLFLDDMKDYNGKSATLLASLRLSNSSTKPLMASKCLGSIHKPTKCNSTAP